MSEEILKKAQEYISQEKHDFFRKQVEDLVAENNIDELTERFYKNLEFGTGGLRGVIGGGYNRMNAFTVQRATQGLATYVSKTVEGDASAVIAYDSRNFSDTFALEAAKVLAGNGIKTYLFSSLRPTPELSFAIRELGATTGIVVTASHNPPQYNGYKAYWNDGCQVLPPHDKAIVEEAGNVTEIKALEKDEAIEKGLIKIIDKEVDEPYIKMVKDLAIRPQLLKEKGKEVKVVFTPLHGTGNVPVSQALSEMGIDVIFVEEQKEPDGNFSTVDYPNPEERSALKLALELAEKKNADLVLATDPDADRLGIAVPGKDGTFVLITGNQLGTLLADYIFSAQKEMGTLPEKPAFIKTIVTTELQKKVADKYNATSFDVLTGFKYIGQKIAEFEAGSEGYQYLFGGEESYGYLVGTSVRDKDAVSAATLTAEMALYYRNKGMSLLDRLNEIYLEHGYYEEALISQVFEGQAGIATMGKLMEQLRTDVPKTLAGIEVDTVKDYLDSTVKSAATGDKIEDIDLPSSNVLQFILKDGSKVTARPSGTEPKIKFYASCCSEPTDNLDAAKAEVGKKIEGIKEDIAAIIKTVL